MEIELLIHDVQIQDDQARMDIAISGGKIITIDQKIETPSLETIDACGRAIIPGFIEPHLHLDKAMLHRRLPAPLGTLEEAIRLTGILKGKQEREDILARSRRVLDMAVTHGTVALRVHSDVDPIQGLIGIETAIALREEYKHLLDMQIVAFPQEGILKSPGTHDLLEAAMSMGADVVGGCPYNESSLTDSHRHIELVFKMAQKHDAHIDMHADFSDEAADERFACAGYIAQKTMETGYQGRVSLGHVTSLASLTGDALRPIIDLLAAADISVVALPATDLYLGGRQDNRNQRRGLTPVRALCEAGVNVTYSSNNIRNAFTPFGNADMLVIGNLLAHVIQFGSSEDQARILAMSTTNAARAIGIDRGYGLAVGNRADLVILDTYQVADALLDLPVRSWVIKKGTISVVSHYSSEIRRLRSREQNKLP